MVATALVLPTSAAVSSSGTATGNVEASPPAGVLGGLPIGCVGAAASFTGQAYCLDGNHTGVLAAPVVYDPIDFGVLALDGWQVPTRCNGNGVSGKREQLVYVHVQGAPDISASSIPFLQQRVIPGANGVFEHTADGKRAIRWVTTKVGKSCVPAVLKVTVPASANTVGFPFSTIGAAVLRAVGRPRLDRSYLVMVDHADYDGAAKGPDCGLGQVRVDGSLGPGNINNSGSAFAMVWANCWNGLTAAHELTHTLGAVQPGAPHHTDLGHCWDGRDDMCYQDGSPQKQRLVCTDPDDYRRLDCNGDDYFALHPKAGSYLASHWNSASSQFLIQSRPTALPTRPGKPAGVILTRVDAHHVRVSWTPGVTTRGALTSWTVLVGATAQLPLEYGGTIFPITDSARQIVLGAKGRSVVIAVRPNAVQGFAVFASNASGDGITSDIASGGVGAAPSRISATLLPGDIASVSPTLTWTGGSSSSGATTCVAVLVNGVRTDGLGDLATTTDPSTACSSDLSPYPLPQPLAPSDVLQVYARNAFGVTTTTVPHA